MNNAERLRQRKIRNRAKGLCAYCVRPSKKYRCEVCAGVERAWQRSRTPPDSQCRYYGCMTPPKEHRTSCEKHLALFGVYSRDRTNRRRVAGLCLKCGRKPEDGRAWCLGCRSKGRAHRVVRWAIKAGKLQRQPCQRCGSPRAEAHHPNYSQPLNILWLCTKCHHGEHRRLRPRKPPEVHSKVTE